MARHDFFLALAYRRQREKSKKHISQKSTYSFLTASTLSFSSSTMATLKTQGQKNVGAAWVSGYLKKKKKKGDETHMPALKCTKEKKKLHLRRIACSCRCQLEAPYTLASAPPPSSGAVPPSLSSSAPEFWNASPLLISVSALSGYP